MMNNTTFADRLAAFRAKNAAVSANVRYAKYQVYRHGVMIMTAEFPSIPTNAKFGGTCFYDPATDSFREGTTDVTVAGTVFKVERVG